MKISKQAALFFWEQIQGEYTGHMANIPFHPVLKSFVEKHCKAHEYKKFATFLRDVADALEQEEKS